MLSIQEIGLSILGDTPKPLYILGGGEYGIKDKYIDILCSKIGPKIEYADLASIVNLMSGFHIIPLQPQVYIVRYDKALVSKLNKDYADMVLSLNIVGTIVLIYETDSDINKLDKFFPNNTAIIDAIDTKLMVKYLHTDFPNLDIKLLTSIASRSHNYYQAKNICRCLNCISGDINLSEGQLVSIFELDDDYSVNDFQVAVASRNFNAYTTIVDAYTDDLTLLLYQILKTMSELDKLLDNKYTDSPLKNYVSKWTRADIYYMFNHTYNFLKYLRFGATARLEDILIYLGSLLKFKSIPDLEVLSCRL